MNHRTIVKPLVHLVFYGSLGTVWWLDHRSDDTGRVDSARFGFQLREASREVGIDFEHEAPILDPKLANVAAHVAGMGAAVAVGDVNDDGWPDLYVTTSRFGAMNALYVNQRDGTFRDVAPAAQVANVNSRDAGVSMGSLFGDLDGDGRSDLLIYKWGYPQLFKNQGDGTFADVTATSGLRRWMNANGAVLFDYDRDGRLDVYVAGYFREELNLWNLETTKIMQESFEFARNGGRNRLFRNLGGLRFEDVTDATGTDSTRWTLAVAASDFNGDGWPDLYLANDYGPEELLLNRGGERFELADAGLEDDSKSGMSVALGDIENEGRMAVYVTNISRQGYLFQGNNLRLNRLAETGTFDNVAEGRVADCGWSWGSQFGDLNNDGWVDLFVANGFISQNPDKDYWYGMSKVASGVGHIFEDATLWPPIEDRSLSGYERSRLLLNREGNGFQDVAAAVGVDDRFDGRAVAFADLFNRGALDVVVANQRNRLLIYRNEVDPTRHWVAFDLHGSDGNSDAIGASVVVEFAGRRQIQAVAAGTGFCSQNDWRLHFGLGATATIDRVRVFWPSGREQEIAGSEFTVDAVHQIKEPKAE